jgi:hypothetical protein
MSQHRELNRRAFLKNAGVTALAGAVSVNGSTEAAAPLKSPPVKFDFVTPYNRVGTDSVKWDQQIRTISVKI